MRALAPINAKATGDPHLQNIFGQRFDLMVPGVHTLINIPRGELNMHSALLRITADAQQMERCGELYILVLNMTGQWLHARGPQYFRAGHAQRRHKSKWMTLGKVDVKVVHGLTVTGIAYLNLMIRNLGKLRFEIGGLLGEDSHALVATPKLECKRIMSL